MPKEAARIFIRVTRLWVERVRDITEAQARAEGFSSRAKFLEAFLKMYPDCTEDSWVWAIEFERISKENFNMQTIFEFIEHLTTETAKAMIPGLWSKQEQIDDLCTRINSNSQLQEAAFTIESIILKEIKSLLSSYIRNNIWINNIDKKNNNSINNSHETSYQQKSDIPTLQDYTRPDNDCFNNLTTKEQ